MVAAFVEKYRWGNYRTSLGKVQSLTVGFVLVGLLF